MRLSSVAVPTLLLCTLGVASPVLAGPPLLCHPFDIGQARSLPWDGKSSWFQGQRGYDLRHLISDTEALLTPSTPVIVRMETLRRAVIYSSQDMAIAGALLRTVTDRARASESAGHADALAFLDAAYVSEALREISELGQMPEFRASAVAVRDLVQPGSGYALIQRSLTLSPEDATLHFAAALIAASNDRQAYVAHATKARAGADRDPLLARNIQHVS
jgi:hypothetical protein